MGASPADSVTRPQMTKPIAISRLQFIREYHIRKFQHPIGQHQTNHYIAIAQHAAQLMNSHPQQEDHSTENGTTKEMINQTEQQDVDNGNLSTFDQDKDKLRTTTIPREFLDHNSQHHSCKRLLNEDEAEQYLSERIKRMRLDSEAGSRDENNSEDEDNDQQNDNHNDDENDNGEEESNSAGDGNSEEDDKSDEDDNVSNPDFDEQDTESTNSEESDNAINEEAGLGLVIQAIHAIHENGNDEGDNILEYTDLDVDVEDLEPMNPQGMEGAINEVGGYAVVYQADHQEPAQNEPQRRVRVPLGEITPHELQRRDNRQPVPEEVQAEDPIASVVRTQRVRIFLRHNMFRSEEEPANEEDEEIQDTMRDFQFEQLAEEADPEPQPLRRSERIRHRRERQEQEQNEEDSENRPLPPHAGPQDLHPVEINGQEFDHQPRRWIFNGTFENMNWTFASDMMRD
jgi:hypothetical protein